MNDNRNEMNSKIKNAFNSVRAEESLKNGTIDFINSKRKKKKSIAFRLAPVLATLVIICGVILFGYNLYSTPVTVLSIDLNRSVELGINRFDKVVTINSFDENGIKLENEIDVKYCNYNEAIKKISEAFENDEEISITVAGKEGKQKNKILSDVEKFTAENQNVTFDKATNEEVEKAHQKGLSFGKYKAYLRLIEEGYEITEEEVKNMSMKDINEKRKNHRVENQDGHKDEFQESSASDDRNPHQNEQSKGEQNGQGNGNHGENKPNQNGENKGEQGSAHK